MAIPEETFQSLITVYLQWQKQFADDGAPEDVQNQLAEVIDEFRHAAQDAADMEKYLAIVAEKGLNEKAAGIYSQALMAQTQVNSVSQSNEQTSQQTDTGEDQVAQAFDMHIQGIRKDREEALQDTNRTWEVPFYDRMIELYESGISYPLYLKAWEEEGFAERMAAHYAGEVRDIYVQGKDNAVEFIDKPHEEMFQELLDAYDQMLTNSKFGAVNPTLWEITSFAIQKKHWSRIQEWNTRIILWSALLNIVDTWVDSFTKYAPYDPRWKYDPDIEEAKRRADWAKNCNPGLARAKEAHLQNMYNISWDDIFTEPTFLYEKQCRDQNKGGLIYSDERLEFLSEAWPHMIPNQAIPDWLVEKSNEMYMKKKSDQKELIQDYNEAMEGVDKRIKEQHDKRKQAIKKNMAGPQVKN